MSGSFHHRAPDHAASAALHKERSVLCVQPSSANQEFLKQALTGFRVVIAASGLEAVRIKNQALFDVYVIDYWLPDWAGVSLCRDIRKADPHVPIIIYTSASSEYAPRAFRAGAMAYLNAPTDAAAFRERVITLLRTADSNEMRARLEEERVIQDELLRRAEAAKERTREAMLQASAAIERAARVKAARAFLSAGGTLAGFERSWPDQFAAARDRDPSAP
jgi:DNA-binding response OmpR family regulator